MAWTKSQWDAIIDLCDEVLQNPPGDTECVPGYDLQFLHRESPSLWRKSDIITIQNALLAAARQSEGQSEVEHPCDISFTELGDYWEGYIITELLAAKAKVWCDCPVECECSPGVAQNHTPESVSIPINWEDYGYIYDNPTIPIEMTWYSPCDFTVDWNYQRSSVVWRTSISGVQLFPGPIDPACEDSHWRFWYFVEIANSLQGFQWCQTSAGATTLFGRGNVLPDGTIPPQYYNNPTPGHYKYYRSFYSNPFEAEEHWYHYVERETSYTLIGICMSSEELIDGGWWDGFGQPQVPWIDFSDWGD